MEDEARFGHARDGMAVSMRERAELVNGQVEIIGHGSGGALVAMTVPTPA